MIGLIQVSWRNNKIKPSRELSQGGRWIRPPVTLRNRKSRSKRRLKSQHNSDDDPRHPTSSIRQGGGGSGTGHWFLSMMWLIEAKWDQWVILSTEQTDNDPKQTFLEQRNEMVLEVKSPDPSRAAVQWLNAKPKHNRPTTIHWRRL